MNPEYSAGIYVTVSVEDECHMIDQNRKMQEEENIITSKVNVFKNSPRITKHGRSFEKILEETDKIHRDMKTSEDPSTPSFKSSSPYPPTPTRKIFIILEGILVSCLTKINGRSRRRLCGNGKRASWEVVQEFCENIMLLDTWGGVMNGSDDGKG